VAKALENPEVLLADVEDWIPKAWNAKELPVR
jgi:hypothetical protein